MLTMKFKITFLMSIRLTFEVILFFPQTYKVHVNKLKTMFNTHDFIE